MNFMAPNLLRPPRTVRTPIHELALVAIIEDAPAAEEAFSRCGWFDSSLELAAGLLVIEYVDSLPADLPFEAVQ